MTNFKDHARKLAEAILEDLHAQVGAEEIETDDDGRPRVTVCGDFDAETDSLDLDTLEVEFGETHTGTHWSLERWGSVEALAEELEEAFEIHEGCERDNAETEAQYAHI